MTVTCTPRRRASWARPLYFRAHANVPSELAERPSVTDWSQLWLARSLYAADSSKNSFGCAPLSVGWTASLRYEIALANFRCLALAWIHRGGSLVPSGPSRRMTSCAGL